MVAAGWKDRLGLGCMRLSTAPDRDEATALAVLHSAFDTGITFLDTADAYCWNAAEAGHNERLIAKALESWSGDRGAIRVATKGGLVRPEGRWEADGRARHLRAACEASRRALGVERLHLYQLHAPDPGVPLATSVRALRALQRDGLIEALGLCNVSLRQLEEALRLVRVACVQVELSPWHDESLRNGVAQRCVEEGIRLLAYRPLGGPERLRRALADPVLVKLAARHGATPLEIALAWISDLSPWILPLPGATRPETIASIAGAARIALTDDDRRDLDERIPAGGALRSPRARRALRAGEGDVVLIMGLPGAGKSTLAEELVGAGYERLNRDLLGGRLASLLPALGRLLASGRRRVVLDNTYVTRRSRAEVVEVAAEHGVPVRCVWLDAALEDAQVNAATRMLLRYGRLLEKAERVEAAKRDPGAFAPSVLFRYARELEPPDPSEGFSRIEVVPFRRRADASFTHRAIVFWLDGLLWRSRSGRRTPLSPDDVLVPPGQAEVLGRYAAQGAILLGLSWQPEIEAGALDPRVLAACFDRLRDELGVGLDIVYCPHAGGPPECWCRKPMPGLGVELVLRHRLDAARCLYVGQGGMDRSFAQRLGFEFREHTAFFGPPAALAERPVPDPGGHT